MSLSSSGTGEKIPVTIKRTIKGLCTKPAHSIVTNGALEDNVAFKFGSAEQKIGNLKPNKISFGKSGVQNCRLNSIKARVGSLPSSTITSGSLSDPELEKMEQIRQNHIAKIAREKEQQEMVEIMIAQKKEAIMFGRKGVRGKSGMEREMEEVRKLKEQLLQDQRLLEAQKKVIVVSKPIEICFILVLLLFNEFGN